MRRLALVLVIAGACSNGTTTTTSPPDLSTEALIELQARTIAASCREANCAGAPIYVWDRTDPQVIDAVRRLLGDEVQLISNTQEPEIIDDTGRYDGNVFSIASTVARLEPGVVGVDVFRSDGSFTGLGKTFLYRWSGSEWIETTSEETGVTVTTSVP